MKTAVITIKSEEQLKLQAQNVANELGLSLSTVINGFLQHFIKTKTIIFTTQHTKEIPSEYMLANLAEAKQDYKDGFISPSFSNAKDAIKWLNNPKRKYERDLRKKVFKTNQKSSKKD